MDALEPHPTAAATPVVDPPKPPSVEPMDVWRSEPRQGDETVGPALSLSTRPPPPISVASSASSLRRRQEYQRRFEQETAARQLRFEQEQAAARVKMEEELRLADLESEAGSVRPIPHRSAEDEQADVAQRRLATVEQESASLRAEAESLRRVLARKEFSPLAFDTLSRSPTSTPAAVDLFGHAKLKVDKPKAWTGQFDHLAREGFIKSVKNYFVSVRISPDTPIDATVLGVVRALFSTDAPKSGGVSPQRWFDSQMDRSKFGSLADVFAAMRAHWVDRDASDRARRALRTAEQGSMKAQEFGALIDSLADECFDRVYDDDSRRDFFVDGLRRDVRDFYRVQLATWKDVHGDREPPFAKAVEIAARSDLLSGRAAEPYAAKSHSSHASKPVSGTKSLHVPKQPAIATTAATSLASAAPASHWYDAATKSEQGSMKAQEFGALIDSLADECFDRVYDDDSRRDFFVDGLRRDVRDFYRVQLATWKDVHGDREPPFAKAVEIAARSDLLSGRAAEPYAAKSHSSHASKPVSGTKSLHVPKQPAIATTAATSLASAAPASHWYDAATKWQAEHPMSQKATWHRSDGPELSKEVRCWNCGKVARHYSTACPNARVDLRKVIVAAIAHLGGDASLVGLGDPDSGMAGREAESESRIVEIEAPGKE